MAHAIGHPSRSASDAATWLVPSATLVFADRTDTRGVRHEQTVDAVFAGWGPPPLRGCGDRHELPAVRGVSQVAGQGRAGERTAPDYRPGIVITHGLDRPGAADGTGGATGPA